MADIWVGQDGERYGPFTPSMVRQGIADGLFLPDALGWRRGMAEWLPLERLVGASPPPTTGPAALFTPTRSTHYRPATEPMNKDDPERRLDDEPARRKLPWVILIPFGIFAIGVLIFVWRMVQAYWH